MDEKIVEVDYSKLRQLKETEMREKYKVAIYDLAEQHKVDIGIGWNILESIARVSINPDEGPMLYHTELVNIDELVEDYKELKAYSDECAKAKGLK